MWNTFARPPADDQAERTAVRHHGTTEVQGIAANQPVLTDRTRLVGREIGATVPAEPGADRVDGTTGEARHTGRQTLLNLWSVLRGHQEASLLAARSACALVATRRRGGPRPDGGEDQQGERDRAPESQGTVLADCAPNSHRRQHTAVVADMRAGTRTGAGSEGGWPRLLLGYRPPSDRSGPNFNKLSHFCSCAAPAHKR